MTRRKDQINGSNRMDKRLPVAKEHTMRGWLFNNVGVKLLAAPFVRAVWVKKVRGLENLPPQGPFIVAANHQSYLDFLTMVAVSPRKLTFLAAEKFYASAVWRPVMEYSGQIKVERDSVNKANIMKIGRKVLREGGALCIFPQGTRSRDGDIGRTYSGVAVFALTSKVPVVPLGIRGAFEVFPPHKKWPRCRKAIELCFGTPMEFDGHYGADKTADLYREITDRIMAEVAHLAGKDFEEAASRRTL